MPLFVRVVPELSLDKAFDYAVPADLEGRDLLGAKVRVPFGSREIIGYVVELLDNVAELTEASERSGRRKPLRIREIAEVLGARPVIPRALLQLAQWMSEYYCAPLANCLKCILPEAVRRAQPGYLQRLWVEAVPNLDVALVPAQLARAKAQREAWAWLQEHGPGWLADYIHESRIASAAWKSLAEKNLVVIRPLDKERSPFTEAAVPDDGGHALNDEQRSALALIEVESARPRPKSILLHGVTGSGKTEVYLRAIEHTLERGRDALVLVPEIALTPQTVERFRARFTGRKIPIAVLHSHLSTGERHDQWQQIRTGKARIVIGARSAVFAPMENLGIVIVDEEHESSYKQEDTPHYHGRDVAVMRGHLEGVPVVLGSATPSLESYMNAMEGKYLLSRLTKRVEVRVMPIIHVLDLRRELKGEVVKKGSKPSLLAPRLVEAVNARLAQKQQVIIFLNRRGYATSLQCPQCGHTEMCPHCSVPLTYHRAAQRLVCHLCDHLVPAPTRCPQCGFDDYKYSGAGTERVEEAIDETFPNARIARMDSDSMRGKDAYRRTLHAFSDGLIDILVGTQMIAKGLHFPNVTLVGVVNADLALGLPDFRASERVFQQLMQVAGRCGRGEVEGEVFVQTRTPFAPAIQFARHHDYDGFAEQELDFRRSLEYPPVQRSILITWRGRDEEKTRYMAEQSAKQIMELVGAEAEGLGPAPAPIYKIKDYYRYHLFLRAARVMPLSRKLRPLMLEAEWPEDMRVSIDVDPVMLL
ncbi:primosomal protein N' [Verrucomicrobia bacterium LW23]|nr:primosomal protein N' [Verrucomicrobia bacterium LW23]